MSELIVYAVDVESIGLHGDSFAVGVSVRDKSGEVDHLRYAVGRGSVFGDERDRAWVDANVPEIPITHEHSYSMRIKFWAHWESWRKRGAIMVADCGWPVEANFLSRAIRENAPYNNLHSTAPYPLHDLATLLLARGLDPLATYPRLPEELPKHDPLADARQTARLFWEHIYGS